MLSIAHADQAALPDAAQRLSGRRFAYGIRSTRPRKADGICRTLDALNRAEHIGGGAVPPSFRGFDGDHVFNRAFRIEQVDAIEFVLVAGRNAMRRFAICSTSTRVSSSWFLSSRRISAPCGSQSRR